MFNLSGGEWIVEALKMLEKSPVLRRIIYTALITLLVYAPGGFTGMALLVNALKG